MYTYIYIYIYRERETYTYIVACLGPHVRVHDVSVDDMRTPDLRVHEVPVYVYAARNCIVCARHRTNSCYHMVYQAEHATEHIQT